MLAGHLLNPCVRPPFPARLIGGGVDRAVLINGLGNGGCPYEGDGTGGLNSGFHSGHPRKEDPSEPQLYVLLLTVSYTPTYALEEADQLSLSPHRLR